MTRMTADAVIITDSEYRVTALNASAEFLTGWRSASAVGMALGRLLGTDSADRALPQGTCTIRTRDCRTHAVRAVSTPIRGPEGTRIGSVTVLSLAPGVETGSGDGALDLATPEVEVAIDALGAGMRERAEEVTALMNVIPVAIYLAHDPDCMRVTANRAAEELLAPPDGCPGASGPYAHRVFQNGRELGPHEMPIQRAAATGTSTNGAEYEIRFESGCSKYIYGYAAPLFGPDGRTRGSVGAFVDVTERRRSENALRESEQRFRVLADNVPVLIWVADRDGQFSYFNKTWRSFTGRQAHEDRGRNWLECVHAADRERVKEDFDRHFARREPFTLELRLRRSDGAYRWVLDTATPLYRHDGDFAGYIGTCVDITPGKLHEQRLEQADRQKDEFIATLAHELRNPLAPIRNSLQILASNTTDGNGMRWARQVIERQVAQLARLIDDLLDVARAACGHLELRRETVTVDSVVHDAIEASRPLIESGRHELHISLPSHPVHVCGDRARLAQIVINLLNNAAKYTPQDGHVWVICERDGDEVYVRVRDNGIGIAPEALPGIFQMFTQLDASLDRSQGGLGVGLALGRKLAELHGGTLDAHSAGPGCGSEFVLKLPAVQPQLAQPSAPGDAVAAPQFAGGHRVLVVDDSEDAAESLAMLLRMDGHTVETANEGPGALRRALAFRPDVMILDIGLPGMDGYELAAHIRQLPGGGELMLIALTGWGGARERDRAYAAGFDHHLTKPVPVEELRQLLAIQLQQ